MAAIADEAARAALTANDWDRAREYFALLAQWRKKLGDNAGEQQARRDAADCYVGQAEAADSRSLQGAFLELAIQSLRTLPNTQADVVKLHERLVEVERESVAEMKEHSMPVDLGENPARARAHVAGLTVQQAIVRTGLLWRPDPVARIQEAVLTTARQAVFFSAVPRVMMNRHGKVIAKRGSLLTGTTKSANSFCGR